MENIPSNIKNFPLLNDVIFKRVFTKKEKSGILEDFLSSILNVKIKRAIVKNAEIPKDALKEKLSVLDIRAETDNNKIVDVEMHIIELPKYRKKKDKTYTKKEQWLSLIAGGKEKKMARLDEPKVKEALKLVEEVLADSKERDLYESRKLAQYDRYCVRKHGEEIGRKKGIREEREKNIKKLTASSKNLFKMGMPKEQIAKVLEIPVQQVEEYLKMA